MKFIICFLFISTNLSSQNINPDTLSFNYTDVVNVDSISSNTLYSNAKLFIAESFASNKAVVQLDDINSYTLLVKGVLIPIIKGVFGTRMEFGFVNFTVKIQCKEGRYKYSISNFYHDAEKKVIVGGDMRAIKPACGTLNMPKSWWVQVKLQTNLQIEIFINSLKKAMANNNSIRKDDF